MCKTFLEHLKDTLLCTHCKACLEYPKALRPSRTILICFAIWGGGRVLRRRLRGPGRAWLAQGSGSTPSIAKARQTSDLTVTLIKASPKSQPNIVTIFQTSQGNSSGTFVGWVCWMAPSFWLWTMHVSMWGVSPVETHVGCQQPATSRDFLGHASSVIECLIKRMHYKGSRPGLTSHPRSWSSVWQSSGTACDTVNSWDNLNLPCRIQSRCFLSLHGG